MRQLFVLLLFLSGGILHAADPFTIPLPKGLNADDDPFFLQDGQSPDSENVMTDEIKGLSGRKGFVDFSTEPSRGIYVFTHSNGNRYLITQSSNILKATLGGTNFTVSVGTVDPNVTTVGSALGDRFYYVNTTDDLRFWDTTSVVTTTSGLKASMIATFKGRLCLAGIANDPRTIYLSKYLDGTSFALVVNPTDADPAPIQVQGSLDEGLSGLYASYNDLLMWFKPHSFGGIQGSRRSSFLSRVFSDKIGSAYPESVQDCLGLLRFIGPNRCIYEFSMDGTSQKLTKISEDIDEYMASVAQGDLNQRSWTQTTQADWTAGSAGLGLSLSSSPGDIVFNPYVVPDDSFIDCDNTNNPAWTISSASMTVDCGRNSMKYFSEPELDTRISVPQGLPTNTTIYWNWTATHRSGSGSPRVTNFSYCFACNITTWDTATNSFKILVTTDASGYVISLYATSNNPNVIASTRITVNDSTENLNISVSKSTGGYFYVSASVGGFSGSTSTTFTAYASADNYFSMGSQSFTGFPGPHSFNLVNVWEFTDVSTNFTGKLGSTFTAQSFNVGDDITSWGSFNADSVLNNGSIAYQLYTDTDSTIDTANATTYSSSQALTSGQVPTIATATYISVRATFSRDFSTYTPTLSDFLVHWNEGSVVRVASIFANRRYWLSVAVSSTSNNRCLIYDRNGNWQRASGINADTMVIYNSNPMFGNSGGIYQFETGYNDDGADIAAYFQTKNFALNNLNFRKTFSDLFMTTTNSDATLQTQYYLDGVNSPFSFANYTMNSESGLQDFRLPFPSTQANVAKTISLKWTVTGQSKWNILNGNLCYTSDTIRQD